MNSLFDRLKSVGFHGAIGFTVVLALVFGYAYGLVNLPDHTLTMQAFTVIATGAGALISAVVLKMGGPKE